MHKAGFEWGSCGRRVHACPTPEAAKSGRARYLDFFIVEFEPPPLDLNIANVVAKLETLSEVQDDCVAFIELILNSQLLRKGNFEAHLDHRFVSLIIFKPF